ncbi:MAG: hypothetical protein JWM50_745 [Microbacteriaceae bacterium]|nr:hypothetical protein [Microbacteriaceae bacterium]
MRRTLITWSAVFALLFVGFGASVVALNASLYSANGFVGRYLEALARHDAAGALELPGVHTSNDAAADLLTGDAMGDLSDVRVLSDSETSDGEHEVVVEYSLKAPGSRSATSRTEFVVAPDGMSFGLFPRWRFVQSPINTVSLTVLHDKRFSVNGHDVTTAAEPDSPATYLVFAPGAYVFGHDSEYLTAKPVPVGIDKVGEITDVAVDVQANETFVTEVQKHVSAYLQDCTTQTVLMPTGCPFGQKISNRLTADPKWTMVTDPAITIVPGTEPGTWAVPRLPATAHLVVGVRSLFDGSTSTYDEDVPFDVQYKLTFEANRQLLITAVYE